MGVSEKNYARIRESQRRIAERRAARSVESGQTESSGKGRDIANGQSIIGEVAPSGPVPNSNRAPSSDRSGVQIPTIPQTQIDRFKAAGYRTDEPTYAKPGRIVGWIANRIGKRLRPKEKKTVEPLPSTYEQKLDQAKKFNASTANLKGIIAAVAVVTSVAGGLLGKQILIDQDTISVAVTNLYQAYMGVLAVIAAITYVLRILKNVKSNWARIKEHGVKVSGPNADLGFDFAPRGDE